MSDENAKKDLGMADRIRRSRGRGARVIPAMAKVTREEREELEAAAKGERKALGEWAREVLLAAARDRRSDAAMFTEIVALRMLLNTVLRGIALGERLSPEAYAQVLAEVRSEKHAAARDMLSQYQNAKGGR